MARACNSRYGKGLFNASYSPEPSSTQALRLANLVLIWVIIYASRETGLCRIITLGILAVRINRLHTSRHQVTSCCPLLPFVVSMKPDNPSFVLRGVEDVVYEQRPIPEGTL
jgi:hypothetical protein